MNNLLFFGLGFAVFSLAIQAAIVKRCANLLDEGCINGGLIGADEEWITMPGNTPGKRNIPTNYSPQHFQRPVPAWHNDANPTYNQNRIFKSLSDFFHKMHMVSTKRCANLFDESCSNGGLPGSGADEEWLGGGATPGKRCLNLMAEGCINGGLPGAGSDEEWLNGGGGPNPGRR